MKSIKMRIAEDERDSIGYISDALAKIRETTDHGFSDEEVNRLKKIESELNDSFKPLMKSALKISDDVSKGLNSFLELSKIIADPTFKALFRASEFGWYISPNAIRDYPLSDLSDLLSQEDISELENILIRDSSKLVTRIIKDASIKFPHRKNLFNEIESCFNDKYYYATVNLAYSQSDGICNEVWNFSFFDTIGKPKRLKAHDEFGTYESGLSSIISNQLSTRKNEITMNSHEFIGLFPEKIKSSFNRHLILHGHSFDYGNRTNALRSILLIDFLIYFKKMKEKSNCL